MKKRKQYLAPFAEHVELESDGYVLQTSDPKVGVGDKYDEAGANQQFAPSRRNSIWKYLED